MNYSKKKVIVADLDGTITEPRMPIDGEMGALIARLLTKKELVIIGGAPHQRFYENLIDRISLAPEHLSRLYIAPNSGSALFKFENGKPVKVYEEVLTNGDKKKIMDAFETVLSGAAYERPDKVYGGLIIDRDTQITFAGAGLEAPGPERDAWDRDHRKRHTIKAALEGYLPDYEIRIGGSSSIDVTKRGIDKAYGITRIRQYLKCKKEEMLFIGDALYDGGNDAPVKKTGIDYVEVSGPAEAKEHIRKLLVDG